MKDFFEKLFDLLYDYIDNIIMLAIIIIVVAIIGWRLDIIFTDDGTSSLPPIEEEFEEENGEDKLEPEEPEETDQPTGETEDPDSEEDEEPETQVGEEIEIDIPSGTLPSGIGNILVENHLIENNNDFLSSVEEENLETGLKAGIYIIPRGSSIDEILEILTN